MMFSRLGVLIAFWSCDMFNFWWVYWDNPVENWGASVLWKIMINVKTKGSKSVTILHSRMNREKALTLKPHSSLPPHSHLIFLQSSWQNKRKRISKILNKCYHHLKWKSQPCQHQKRQWQKWWDGMECLKVIKTFKYMSYSDVLVQNISTYSISIPLLINQQKIMFERLLCTYHCRWYKKERQSLGSQETTLLRFSFFSKMLILWEM